MKKVLIGILVFVLLAAAVVGYTITKKTEPEQTVKPTVKKEQRRNVKETDAETGEEYYLLADFENYFECAQVSYNASFGTITPITKKDEPDMVPYGEQSVKLEILGTEETWRMRRPTMRFYNGSGFFDETTDFSNMSKITFDIYNAQDYEACIRFYIDEGIEKTYNPDMSLHNNTDYAWNTVILFDLKPNSWNHIEIPAEDIRIVRYDANLQSYFAYGADALSLVGGFNIEFDRGEIHEEQEVFYFDNLRAYLKSE